MKLNELILPNEKSLKLSLNKIPEELEVYTVENFLKSKGYQSVGMGANSEVYNKLNSSGVLKICFSPDSAWLKYAKICLKYSNNPYFMKISRIITYNERDTNHTLFLAFMEKLQKIPNEEFKKLAAFFAIYGHNLCQKHSLQYWEKYWINENYTGNDYENNLLPQTKSVANNFIKNNPLFISALEVIVKNKGNDIMDLHNNNLMFRKKDNMIVIIDPYLGSL